MVAPVSETGDRPQESMPTTTKADPEAGFNACGSCTVADDYFEDWLVHSNSMVALRTAKIRMISNT